MQDACVMQNIILRDMDFSKVVYTEILREFITTITEIVAITTKFIIVCERILRSHSY